MITKQIFIKKVFIIFTILTSSNLFAQVDLSLLNINDLLGKNWSSVSKLFKIKLKNKIIKEPYNFIFDDSTTVYYNSYQKKNDFYNFFVFNDKIFRIVHSKDFSLFDSISYVSKVYSDSIIQYKFDTYHVNKYQNKPMYDSIYTGFFDMIKNFRIESGSVGEKYIYCYKAELNSVEILNLVLSFKKQNRLIGLLLIQLQNHKELSNIFNNFSTLNNYYNVGYGCEPMPYLTYKEIIENNYLFTFKGMNK